MTTFDIPPTVPDGPIAERPAGYYETVAQLDILTNTLRAAGVELSEFEQRTASWLATWEWATVAVVASWVARATAARKAAPSDATLAAGGTTARDGLPTMLTWTGSARVPDAHAAHKRVVVNCVSAHGDPADLVLDGDDRTRLASLLDSEVIRDINARCPHEAGCGSDIEHLSSTGVSGWFRLEIGGLDGGPRWYCSPGCVNAAMLRAADDLALAHGQAFADELDARYGPGASDEYAMQTAEAMDASFEDERGDADEVTD